MSAVKTNEPILRSRIAPPDLAIVNWPIRDGGWLSWGVAASELLLAGLAGWWFGSFFTGLIVLVPFAVASWRLWCPVEFELGPSGITEKRFSYRSRVPWRAVSRFEICRDGVLLFTDDALSPLSSFHGRYLHWNHQRTAVLELFDFYVSTQRG